MSLSKLNQDCLIGVLSSLSLPRQLHFRLVSTNWHHQLTVILRLHRHSLAIRDSDPDNRTQTYIHQSGCPQNDILILPHATPIPSADLLSRLIILCPRMRSFTLFVTPHLNSQLQTTLQATLLVVFSGWNLKKVTLGFCNPHSPGHTRTDASVFTEALWNCLTTAPTAGSLTSLHLLEETLPKQIEPSIGILLAQLKCLELGTIDAKKLVQLPATLLHLKLGNLNFFERPRRPQLLPVERPLKHLSMRTLNKCTPRGNERKASNSRVFDFLIDSFPHLESLQCEFADFFTGPWVDNISKLSRLSHLKVLQLCEIDARNLAHLPATLCTLNVGSLNLAWSSISRPQVPVEHPLKHLSIRTLNNTPKRNRVNQLSGMSASKVKTFAFLIDSFPRLDSLKCEFVDFFTEPHFRYISKLPRLTHLTSLRFPGFLLLNCLSQDSFSVYSGVNKFSLPFLISLDLHGFEATNCALSNAQIEPIARKLCQLFPALCTLTVRLPLRQRTARDFVEQLSATRWLAKVEVHVVDLEESTLLRPFLPPVE